MLKLRRARVLEAADPEGSEQHLRVEVAGRRRAAIAEVPLVGRAQAGDELLVNVQAQDLGLGSGGFDIVHANLTRGLDGEGSRGAVMKLNYTSLQHAVEPVEEEPEQVSEQAQLPLERPVAVLALHGQLAALAWAFAEAAPGRSLGFVQTEGGALPGGRSRTVRALRERGLLAGHICAGAAFGGEADAITTAGALHHGLRVLGWDAAVCGPGPGIVGSASALGHGGMVALDSAHTALALGCPALLVARMSSGDARPRHRGISHHSLTVLELLLAPVSVALPAGMRSPIGADLRAGLGAALAGSPDGVVALAGSPDGVVAGTAAASERPGLTVEVGRPARIARHDWRHAGVDLPGFAASGLPAETMGRGVIQDPLFFGAALAGGRVLAELVSTAPGGAAAGVASAPRTQRPTGRATPALSEAPGGRAARE